MCESPRSSRRWSVSRRWRRDGVKGRGTLTRLFLIALLLAVAVGAVAQEPTTDTETDESRFIFQEQTTTPEPAEDSFAGIGFWDLARMLFILGIVIVVIYLFFNILKRSTAGRVNSGESIRMLGSRALPGNKSLHVVQVGNHVYLVGAGESAVSLISEITDQETLDELRLSGEETTPVARKSFPEMLGSVLRPAGDGVGSFDFMHRQRERLRKMR